MNAFHPITIGLLRAALDKYADELEDALGALATAQFKADEKAAIVADCEQFLAYAESTNAAERTFADESGHDEMPDQYYDPTATPLAVAFGAAESRLMCVRCGIGDRDTEWGLCRSCDGNDEPTMAEAVKGWLR